MNHLLAGPADIYNPALNAKLGNAAVGGEGANILSRMLANLINLAFVIGGVIFLFMLLRGGLQYLSSGGDKEALQNAQKRIFTALTGLVILFSTYAIIGIISAVFGINLISLNITTF